MKLAHSLNSGAFRFALLIATLFAVGSMALLFMVERSVAAYEASATTSGLESETIILTREQAEGGLAELIDTIEQRQTPTAEQQFRYLLLDDNGHRLAGDLPLAAARLGRGSVHFVDDHPPPGEEGVPEEFQTLGSRLQGGGLLIVGTDTYDIYKLRHRLHNLEVAAAIILTLVALIGGYVVGLVFLRRLERVNEAIGRVMGGSLSERLPPIGMAPEFDRLSANLNLMLDRIGELMEGLRQVSTDIAHDLRTPLTRLRQRLETMQDATSVEMLRESADVALAQTDEIMSMFRALLRIGVIEGGQAQAHFTRLDLAEIADRVVQIYRPLAEDSGRRLVSDLTPAAVRGDSELLAQVFANLVDNALKYAPPGTTITVSVALQGDSRVAQVADDGPGIPEAERPKVLRRFYRIDASRSEPGAGLGLAMVQAIARLHDASLVLASNEPGLRVRLEFPPP